MVNKYIGLGVIFSIMMFSISSIAQGRYDQRHFKRNVVIVKKTSYEEYRDSNYGRPAYGPGSQNYERRTNYNRFQRDSMYDSDHDYDSDNDLDKNSAPFPSKISSSNIIKVDLGKLAWGAYDDEGNLVKWGRASGGKNYCADINRGCKTITGTFTIYRKQGPECKSNRFPVGKGGAPMPYCMHFHGAYAMHGGQVPNYNASHGCVRLLRNDAQWLNEDFVRVGRTRVSVTY